MFQSIDQLGTSHIFASPPTRIICLVPSITEFLYAIGLKNEIIGQTIFCIYPKNAFKNSIKIGGTKNINVQKILDLKPDIVIANQEENEETQINSLQNITKVWVSKISTYKTALDMMQKLALLFNKYDFYIPLENRIKLNWKQCKNIEIGTFIYLIWQNPYMSIGTDTYINAVLKQLGLTNLITTKRYPSLTDYEIADLNPKYIFLSSEPFPFKEKHIQKLKEISPNSTIKLINGEICSWYGSKMENMHAYFNTFFNK